MKGLTELNVKYNLQEMKPRQHRYVGANLTQVGLHFTSEMTSIMRNAERVAVYIDPDLSAILIRPCAEDEGYKLGYVRRKSMRDAAILANRRLYAKMKAGHYELEDQLDDGTFLLINKGI